MLDMVVSELVKSAVSVAKDILGNRVKEANEKLLQEKRNRENEKNKRKEKTELSGEELRKILLEPQEEIKAEVIIVENKALASLLRHIEDTRKWCDYISFSDLRGAKKLGQIYIELDTYVMPLRTHFNISERTSLIPLQKAILDNEQHIIVLGAPGAGKTTSMKKLCSNLLSSDTDDACNQRFPILIRFRDLNSAKSDKPIFAYLSDLFNIELLIDPKELTNTHVQPDVWRHDVLLSMLDELRPLVILDGFDELSTQSQKDISLQEIRELTRKLSKAKIIVTCRTGEFNYNIDRTKTFEIASLSEEQIFAFANKWILDSEKALAFVNDIRKSPFSDTTIKPLSLAHLCAIYERTGSIPDRPKTVYKKVVNLLLDEWDEQRSVKRISRYSQFECDRKAEFLNQLSFYLTTESRASVFSQQLLIEAYLAICSNFGLPENQCKIVANEIESHTGLILQTGYLQYEFAHKSLQEYLTAEYLVKLPSLEKIRKHIDVLGAELAIATSISSNPSLYFSELLLSFNKGDLSQSFYDAFISRLAQERPDFYYSEDLVLAAFSLLSHRGDDPKYLALMQSTLKIDNPNALSDYYQLEEQNDDGNLVLRRIKAHKFYNLKTWLAVPKCCYSEYIASSCTTNKFTDGVRS